jgi:glycosyltransferase involved in cell wall biosynthesis
VTFMRLSLILPIYNEAAVLPLLMRSLRPVLDGLNADYEVVFVDDGSQDGSRSILRELAERDGRVKVITFPRNFGHQAAISAGLDFAAGDAVVIMDADLQDPPDLLPRMLELFQEGYDVVSPQRRSRRGDSFFKRMTAGLFYWLMRHMVDKRLPDEVGDFRLLSRRAVSALRQFREQHRFMRGMVAWLGLKEVILPFERQPRAAGETKYPLHKMLRFSWTAISSFSAFPLRVCTFVGICASGAGLLYILYALYVALLRKTAVQGWTSLVFLQCFFFGITLLSLGLVGDYIARIYEESKNRPLYVVSQAVNVDVGAHSIVRAIILPERAPTQMLIPALRSETQRVADGTRLSGPGVRQNFKRANTA